MEPRKQDQHDGGNRTVTPRELRTMRLILEGQTFQEAREIAGIETAQAMIDFDEDVWDFRRIVRTPSSEEYEVYNDREACRCGRVNIHYLRSSVSIHVELMWTLSGNAMTQFMDALEYSVLFSIGRDYERDLADFSFSRTVEGEDFY